ncbi:MAG: ABC transporter ATP-binding protein [Muribaculaceae bacterium]|nr:ABC transporter ATP-binding protein [Roseburia sp.]MCM1430267.1 ABC transporter ATP-binding protein [Muribaculaceae bacterium]MCM1492624.1 ABC transporter ATP-binding protein [Muribaculaceae bacterium]
MKEALRTEKLYLRRGRFLVSDVNLSVETGQMLAIGGRSGAGKSTLIRGIGGAFAPEAGKICYWGKELWEDEANIRRQMSLVHDEPNFNTELKPERLVREIVRFEPFFAKEAFFIYMEQMELDPRQRVKLYSPGMVKKLMLVLALCRSPELLVMDEPTSGADVQAKALMWEIIEDYRKNHPVAVVYTTHHESELAKADNALYLRDGRLTKGEDRV